MADAVLHLSLPVVDLGESRVFYEEALGCRVGRVRESWLDVWFFGMQITLQERPEQVAALPDVGVRHFGVTLTDQDAFSQLVARIDSHGARWIDAPGRHEHTDLSGKVAGKLADPSGNVIEIKWYGDMDRLQSADNR
jgi:extradiol dioxygenase family protein